MADCIPVIAVIMIFDFRIGVWWTLLDLSGNINEPGDSSIKSRIKRLKCAYSRFYYTSSVETRILGFFNLLFEKNSLYRLGH